MATVSEGPSWVYIKPPTPLKKAWRRNFWNMEEQKYVPHVLLLPYPSQGHINPILQFAKRLASHGLRTSLAMTRYIANSTQPELGPVSVESISDGFDHGGIAVAASFEDYQTRFQSAGSETLSELIESLRSKGDPVQALVYDSFLPWAFEVANRFGLRTASFFTQSCAVNALYWRVWEGRLKFPATGPVELVPGLPRFEPGDFPSILSGPDSGPNLVYLALLLNQYKNLEKADAVLVNSFYELEPEEFKWMKSSWPVKSIGPTLPSAYIDDRIRSDSHYGLNIYPPDSKPYRNWLDSKPQASVIYVSFGSMASLSSEQMREIASALASTKYSFVWVVRASESAKLPENFVLQESTGRGMVVSWCNQLSVLAHDAVGCFLTHCGWNSTMEGIALGVPMLAMPHWSDQPTNAKYIEDVWGTGVRVRVEGDSWGIVRREEVERGIREVMEGERSEEMRRNVAKWKELAKSAVSEGGSSDKNILEFIAEHLFNYK